MSVLVYAESLGGVIKKAAQEAVSYGVQAAQVLGTDCIAVTIGNPGGASELGKIGAKRVVDLGTYSHFDAQVYTSILAQAAQQLGAEFIVMAHSSTGKSIAGRLSARLDAAMASSVTTIPVLKGNAVEVRKGVFSGKAFATYELSSPIKIVTIAANTFRPEDKSSSVQVESLSVNAPQSKIQVIESQTVTGTVPLPEADLVVSAGRGMKGPENWGIIEELAQSLGAATACSRPVADVHWRPHHEHVGQTGVAIRPTLYFAIGISGAIQHLAGVNQSKVIVVINNDPEAPFFKAADYGVVGDLFDVVPKLTSAINRLKAQQ